MNKKLKWGLVALILLSLTAWGIYSQLPKTNKELAAADKVVKGQPKSRALNVNAIIAKKQTLSDQILINGNILPDEEVCHLP